MFGEKDSDIGTLFLLLYLPIIPHLWNGVGEREGILEVRGVGDGHKRRDKLYRVTHFATLGKTRPVPNMRFCSQ
jgi:hypothetical protein